MIGLAALFVLTFVTPSGFFQFTQSDEVQLDKSIDCVSGSCTVTVNVQSMGEADKVVIEKSAPSSVDSSNHIFISPGTQEIDVKENRVKFRIQKEITDGDGALSETIDEFEVDILDITPQAGVTFDESLDQEAGTDGDTDGYQVVMQIVSIEHADKVTVDCDNNGQPEAERGAVGDTYTCENLKEGDTVVVRGVLDGQTDVLQTYTIP